MALQAQKTFQGFQETLINNCEGTGMEVIRNGNKQHLDSWACTCVQIEKLSQIVCDCLLKQRKYTELEMFLFCLWNKLSSLSS